MIRQVSVDDRLLHGQVAFYWTSYYNLDTILVLNDEAANDEFTKMILGLAKPREVRLQIAEVEAGFEIVQKQLESPENVLIIVGADQRGYCDLPEVIGTEDHDHGTAFPGSH